MTSRITTNHGIRSARRLGGLLPYASPKPRHEIDVWLDGNEGVGPQAELLHGVHDPSEVMRRYPSAASLEAMLAAHFGMSSDGVLATAGADDALFRICLAMLEENRELIVPIPTFEMLERYAHLAGGRVVTTPWTTGPYPTDAVLDALTSSTALIAVVSPNNPTGAAATSDDLRRLSARAPHALLLVDLAYAEFAAIDLTATALALPNALVVRTFSKAWGLAGLRVGYAMGPSAVIHWMRCVGNPYAVSGLSAALAQARFTSGAEAMKSYVARVCEERTALFSLLRALGSEPLASEANFILARFEDAERTWDGLARRGIAVRRFPAHAHLHNHLRITCPGEPRIFARLTEALRHVHSEMSRTKS
jgi:histidinol-phosphate aminotransferase